MDQENCLEDVGLDDEGLVTIPIKQFNKLLKDKGIKGTIREKEIKKRRRTLLNRGIK